VHLAELHLRAMRALVAELEREKYAVSMAHSELEPRPELEPARTPAPRRRGRHIAAFQV